jgi:hypothetical protein
VAAWTIAIRVPYNMYRSPLFLPLPCHVPRRRITSSPSPQSSTTVSRQPLSSGRPLPSLPSLHGAGTRAVIVAAGSRMLVRFGMVSALCQYITVRLVCTLTSSAPTAPGKHEFWGKQGVHYHQASGQSHGPCCQRTLDGCASVASCHAMLISPRPCPLPLPLAPGPSTQSCTRPHSNAHVRQTQLTGHEGGREHAQRALHPPGHSRHHRQRRQVRTLGAWHSACNGSCGA